MDNILTQTMEKISRLFIDRHVILSQHTQEELKAILIDSLTRNFQEGQAMAFHTMLRFNRR